MDMDGMMIPYLHFAGGDNLFFKPLTPTSPGAIAGACIILGCLAIFERWVSAMRGSLETYLARRAQVMMADRHRSVRSGSTFVSSTSVKEIDEVKAEVNSLKKSPSESGAGPSTNKARRTSPPFFLSNEVPRGLAFAFQALLGYVLMLAVMTFQAAYIISIIVGRGIGEVLFGRLGNEQTHALH